jgi:hypothetical protein
MTCTPSLAEKLAARTNKGDSVWNTITAEHAIFTLSGPRRPRHDNDRADIIVE